MESATSLRKVASFISPRRKLETHGAEEEITPLSKEKRDTRQGGGEDSFNTYTLPKTSLTFNISSHVKVVTIQV